ncbi:zinc-binding dehydrogenase [Fodinicola feengrottensis]|uniref:zinc-binding dehydrogenase n=1 Tax=Fodinicola feengrottensis TaxID=435914 RepID=UPI0024410622|nr:zinc-binding dehydrogenase [Fodinicola feengrottensis]
MGSRTRGEGLAALGAAEIVTSLENVEPVFGVLDNVGGPLLAAAFGLVVSGGSARSIGQASGQPTTIAFEAERLRGRDRRIQPFVIQTPLGEDLQDLVALLARKELDPQVGWRAPWTRAADAVEALLGRQVHGKVVLDITA